MSFITKSDLKRFAYDNFAHGMNAPSLNESRRTFSTTRTSYDIFLSHSYLDKAEVNVIKHLIESFNFSVYVDWIEDSHLDRNNVNRQTAQMLKKRMKKCKCLLFAISENSPESKWMPWELGFFDGYKNKAAILPITTSTDEFNAGSEYLELYPFIQKELDINGNEYLWVVDQQNTNLYSDLWNWIYSKGLPFHKDAWK